MIGSHPCIKIKTSVEQTKYKLIKKQVISFLEKPVNRLFYKFFLFYSGEYNLNMI